MTIIKKQAEKVLYNKKHPKTLLVETTPLLPNSDEGQKNVKRTRRQIKVMVIIATGNLLNAVCTSLQGPFFPREAELKGATPTQYGLIFAVYQLSVLLSAPIYAKMMVCISPVFLAKSGLFCLSGSSILFGILNMASSGMPFISLAFAVRTFEGLASSAWSTSCFAIIAAEFPNKVGTTFSSLETFFGVGLIAGPTIGGFLYELGGFTLPFAVVGALLFVCFCFSLFTLTDVTDKTREVQRSSLIKFLLHPGTMIHALAILTTMMYVAYNGAILEPFLRQFALTPVMVGLIFVVSGAVYAVSAPIFGWMCDKMESPKLLCGVGCFLNCVFLLFVGPAPFFPIDTTLWLVILSLVIFGVATAAVLVSAMIGVMNDTLERGFANDQATFGLVASLFSSAIAIGSFTGPSIGGYLEEVVGYRKGTFVLLVISVLTFILVLIYLVWSMRTSRKKSSVTKVDDEAPTV